MLDVKIVCLNLFTKFLPRIKNTAYSETPTKGTVMDETTTPSVQASFDNTQQVIATTAVITVTVVGVLTAVRVGSVYTLKALNRINRRLEKENSK